MSDFERAKALLQKKQGSSSVYDHLSEVILKLVTEEPADSLALFEHLSSLVKQGAYPGNTTGARAGGGASESEVKAAESGWASAAASVLAAPENPDGNSAGVRCCRGEGAGTCVWVG